MGGTPSALTSKAKPSLQDTDPMIQTAQTRLAAARALVQLLEQPDDTDPPTTIEQRALPVVDAIAHFTLQLMRTEAQVKPFHMNGLTLTAELTPKLPPSQDLP